MGQPDRPPRSHASVAIWVKRLGELCPRKSIDDIASLRDAFHLSPLASRVIVRASDPSGGSRPVSRRALTPDMNHESWNR